MNGTLAERLLEYLRKNSDGGYIAVDTKAAAAALNMSVDQVHDAMFMLAKSGVIRRVRRGNRFTRPVVELVGRHSPAEVVGVVRCPNCGHEFDILQELMDRVEALRSARAKLEKIAEALAQMIDTLGRAA